MKRLLCRLGIHNPGWQPATPPGHNTWLHVRTCTRCGYPVVQRPQARR